MWLHVHSLTAIISCKRSKDYKEEADIISAQDITSPRKVHWRKRKLSDSAVTVSPVKPVTKKRKLTKDSSLKPDSSLSEPAVEEPVASAVNDESISPFSPTMTSCGSVADNESVTEPPPDDVNVVGERRRVKSKLVEMQCNKTPCITSVLPWPAYTSIYVGFYLYTHTHMYNHVHLLIKLFPRFQQTKTPSSVVFVAESFPIVVL